MIACACIMNSSSSSSENPIFKTQKKLNPCKSCRGKVLVDDQTSPQGNMVSDSRSFQVSKSIDPQLKWKNSRKRAARKMRTSCMWSNINFSDNKNKDSMSIEEDMLFSESEKVSVSILGRRFRDTSGNTPPKKRKILPHPSLTSPHCSSSNSDDLGYAVLKRKQDSLHFNSVSVLEGIEKNSCIADFSGISILAAVACDSDLVLASSDVQESLKENGKVILSPKPNGNDLPMPQISEDLAGKPSDASCLSALHSKRLMKEVKSDESVKSFQKETMEFTSNSVSPPWDLNTAIDESSEHETICSESKNMDRDGVNENSEQLMSQLKFIEPKDLHRDPKIVESKEIRTCDMFRAKCDSDFEAEMRNNISGYGFIEESKKSTTVSAISMDTQVVGLKSNTENCKQAPPVIDTKTTSSCLASCDHVLTDSHIGMNNGLIGVKSYCTDQESFCSHSSSRFEEQPKAFGKNACDKTTECMVSGSNSPMNMMSNTHHGNSVNPEENNNSDYETSMKIKLDTSVSANGDTAKSDFSVSIQMDLGNHIEGHNSDVDQTKGMEKLEFLSDDDSQYEDGELREPLTNSWLDGVEEDDADTVDYGSDKDKDTYNDTSELPSVRMHTINDVGVLNDTRKTRNHVLENNDARKNIYSPYSFSKMSRWDRLPGRCTNSSNSVSKYHDQYYRDPSRASQAYNSTDRVKLSFCRDLTGISRNNDNSKDRQNRSTERRGFSPHVEKHREGPQPIQRNFSSMHSQDNGRSDYRARFSPKYHGSNRLDSPTYYHSRNAVAAKIANIERNGFVVAHDGTIVKVKASSYRDTRHSFACRGTTPIDRERKYGMSFKNYRMSSPEGSTFASSGNVGRYSHGVDAVNSSSPMHRSNFRRYLAPSPPRSQFHLSRSPSRSRMHSPHRWVSPRGRNDLSSSKSPEFINTGTRASRPISDFGDCANHGSLPRNYASPPHVSRWIHDRKDGDHFREPRVERHGYRFDSVHYQGRGKQGENTQSMNSGRFHDISGGSYDIRERQRQYTKNGNMRRPWYDDEDGFLDHNARQKSSDFHGRDGPRVLD